jgi:F-type H+-transporting ATPase subunit b
MEIQVGAILLQMINFGVVVGAISFLLLKPVRRILNERSRKIQEGLEASEAAVKKQTELDSLGKGIELKAQEKAKAIIDEARKDAKVRAAEITAEAQEKAKEIIAKGEKQAETAKATIMADLQDQFESAVVAVAAKVIGAELSTKQHTDLIKQSIKEIEAA